MHLSLAWMQAVNQGLFGLSMDGIKHRISPRA